jgi:hypothetical protein
MDSFDKLASPAHASFDFSACKTFTVVGVAQCSKDAAFQDCRLVLAKGTRSEVQAKLFAKLDPDTTSFSKFDQKLIKVKVLVKDKVGPVFEIIGRPMRTIELPHTLVVQCAD